jgi:hypothetical protein
VAKAWVYLHLGNTAQQKRVWEGALEIAPREGESLVWSEDQSLVTVRRVYHLLHRNAIEINAITHDEELFNRMETV